VWPLSERSRAVAYKWDGKARVPYRIFPPSPPSRHTRGELRPVALVRRPAFGGAMLTLLRVRRERAFGLAKLDGASRPPRRTGSWQPSFFYGRTLLAVVLLRRSKPRRLGAEGTHGVGRDLQTRVRSSNLFGKVSSSWKEVLYRASSPASWPDGRSANIHRMRSQSRTTPLPVPCYQSSCSIPSDAIFSSRPARSSNE
jgi:hypothetical protein